MMGPASEGRSAAAGSCPGGGVVARDRAGAMPVRQRVSETGVPEMGVPAAGAGSSMRIGRLMRLGGRSTG